MGDMVDTVDRRVGAIHGRVGAARVGVGAGGRPLPATADPVVGLNAYGDTTMPRAGSVRGRSAAASAASGAKCGPVDRASAQSGTAYAHTSAARGRRTGDARLQQGSRSAAADHAGRSAVAPAAVVVTRKGAHLTRRGQLVLIALLAVVALAVAGLLMSRTGGTATERPEPVGQRSIVVQPGQTLWSIAKDVAPDRDIREVIYEIRRINGLDNAMVRSGQTLVLPSG
ncbi:MAG TPA: LysM peptidoglycan-binding domain-containing protein [Actinomycetes bacterium]|nr:LysM peptidoglycan-binding domain-containing protein [Actinomycetes bacterium]